MKATNKFVAVVVLLSTLVGVSSFAQTGNDSPGGVSGGFNGQVTTGCSYDPYTGNATRAITDIVVSGSVGAYPLAFTRYANSRYAAGIDDFGNGVNPDFGEGASWTHSYQWVIDSKGTTANATPVTFFVRYPDGRVIPFSAATSCGGGGGGGGGSSCDPYLRGGTGIRDRLQVIYDSSSAGRVYLHLSDGGKVYFTFTVTPGGSPGKGWNYYTYQVQSITDPYGQTMTISGSPVSGGSVTITEPAGRWLKLHYTTINNAAQGAGGDLVIDQVIASDGRAVQYSYKAYAANGTTYTTLANVTYYGDSNLKASYTYQGSGGNPLLSTCIDPMYGGPMWKIAYKFASGFNIDNTTMAVPGQIQSENYFDGTTVGAAVSTLTMDNSNTTYKKRTELRGDGPSRTFTYSNALLNNWTDFKGVSASRLYDSNGYVKSVTDFNSHTTSFTNDAFTGVVTQITYPSTSSSDCPSCTTGGTIKYAYVSPACSGSNTCDPNNQDTNNQYYLFSATDEAGNTSYVLRDSNKRVTQKNYADGGSESFTYNSFGEVLTHRLLTGGLETYTYDGRGLLTQFRDPYHLAAADPQNPSVPASTTPSLWYTYDGIDRVSAVTDALGSAAGDVNHTTSYAYNSRGDITTTTLPVDPVDGQRHTVMKVIDPPSGTVTSTTDQLGHATRFTYDDYRRLLTTTTPPRFSGDTINHTSSVYYDANGTGNDYTHTDADVTHATSPAGKKTATVYDQNKRKTSVTVAVGTSDAATTTFAYDLNGNLTSVAAPNEQPGQQFAGQRTTTTYDERNTPYSVRDPLGNVTSCTYDAGGRKKTVTRANGQVTSFDNFDAMNRLLQSTIKQTPDPDAVTKYTYYNSGLLQTMQDPRQNNYTYQYDLMGRKTTLTYPSGGGTELWHYDNGSRLDTFTNRNGNTQRTTYDNLNRATNIAWDDSGLTPTVTFGYDVASRVTAINNANAKISHAFFDDSLLSSETATYADNTARMVSYTYDADANRATIQYPNNAYSFTYNYTGRNQLQRLANSADNTFLASYNYDGDGNLINRTPNNATGTGYTYDSLDRVTHINHVLNGTTRTFDYAYDSVGNRKWTKRDNGTGDVFGYDLADQSISILLNVANPDTISPGNQTITYDPNGNRFAFSAYGQTDNYATNNLNQYTQRNSSTAGYDTKGNMKLGFNGSTYTYDAQDRILSATNGGTAETFTCDGLNRQVSRTIGSGSAIYNVYDGWNLIAEYVSGATSPTNAYLAGAGGLIKNLITNRYYYQDASGSTSHLADNTGHLLEWYRYDLQGTPVVYNSSNQLSSNPPSVRHLFTGQQWYSELGLYDLRNRFYSPDIGRFLQPDPIGFSGDLTNLYRYCGNSPTNRKDPDGKYAPGQLLPDVDPRGQFVMPTPEQAAGPPIGVDSNGNPIYAVPADPPPSWAYPAFEWILHEIILHILCPECYPKVPQPFVGDVDQNSARNMAWLSPGSDGDSGGGIPIYAVDASGTPIGGFFSSGTWVASGSPVAYGYGAMGFSMVGIPGTFVTTDSGETYSTAVGQSMDPTGQDNVLGSGAIRIAVAESASARDPFSGPTVAGVSGPSLYATGWKWVKDPWSSFPYGAHQGWWKATGWTTDPALAVPVPRTNAWYNRNVLGLYPPMSSKG